MDSTFYDDPNFAIICGFFDKFGKMCGVPFPLPGDLVTMLQAEDEIPHELAALHTQLLRKIRRSTTVDKWERSAVKFCQAYLKEDADQLVNDGYLACPIDLKLRLLRTLLETQFDHNTKFKSAVNLLTAEELRSKPLGADTSGRVYWAQLDSGANLKVYQEDPESEGWKVVAHDRETMVTLIKQLSGDDTIDLSPIVEPVAPVMDTGQDTSDEEGADGEANGELSEGTTEEDDVASGDNTLSDAPPEDDSSAEKNVENGEDNEKTSKDSSEPPDIENGAQVNNGVENNKRKISDDEEKTSKDSSQPPDNETSAEGGIPVKNGVENKKRKISDDSPTKGKKAKTSVEPVKECETEPFECSEAIEEPVLHVQGEGSGAECDAANPDPVNTSSQSPAVSSTAPAHTTHSVDNLANRGDGEVVSSQPTDNGASSSDKVESIGDLSEADRPKLWSIDDICSSSTMSPEIKSSSVPSFVIDNVENAGCTENKEEANEAQCKEKIDFVEDAAERHKLSVPDIIITPTTPESIVLHSPEECKSKAPEPSATTTTADDADEIEKGGLILGNDVLAVPEPKQVPEEEQNDPDSTGSENSGKKLDEVLGEEIASVINLENKELDAYEKEKSDVPVVEDRSKLSSLETEQVGKSIAFEDLNEKKLGVKTDEVKPVSEPLVGISTLPSEKDIRQDKPNDSENIVAPTIHTDNVLEIAENRIIIADVITSASVETKPPTTLETPKELAESHSASETVQLPTEFSEPVAKADTPLPFSEISDGIPSASGETKDVITPSNSAEPTLPTEIPATMVENDESRDIPCDSVEVKPLTVLEIPQKEVKNENASVQLSAEISKSVAKSNIREKGEVSNSSLDKITIPVLSEMPEVEAKSDRTSDTIQPPTVSEVSEEKKRDTVRIPTVEPILKEIAVTDIPQEETKSASDELLLPKVSETKKNEANSDSASIAISSPILSAVSEDESKSKNISPGIPKEESNSNSAPDEFSLPTVPELSKDKANSDSASNKLSPSTTLEIKGLEAKSDIFSDKFSSPVVSEVPEEIKRGSVSNKVSPPTASETPKDESKSDSAIDKFPFATVSETPKDEARSDFASIQPSTEPATTNNETKSKNVFEKVTDTPKSESVSDKLSPPEIPEVEVTGESASDMIPRPPLAEPHEKDRKSDIPSAMVSDPIFNEHKNKSVSSSQDTSIASTNISINNPTLSDNLQESTKQGEESPTDISPANVPSKTIESSADDVISSIKMLPLENPEKQKNKEIASIKKPEVVSDIGGMVNENMNEMTNAQAISTMSQKMGLDYVDLKDCSTNNSTFNAISNIGKLESLVSDFKKENPVENSILQSKKEDIIVATSQDKVAMADQGPVSQTDEIKTVLPVKETDDKLQLEEEETLDTKSADLTELQPKKKTAENSVDTEKLPEKAEMEEFINKESKPEQVGIEVEKPTVDKEKGKKETDSAEISQANNEDKIKSKTKPPTTRKKKIAEKSADGEKPPKKKKLSEKMKVKESEAEGDKSFESERKSDADPLADSEDPLATPAPADLDPLALSTVSTKKRKRRKSVPEPEPEQADDESDEKETDGAKKKKKGKQKSEPPKKPSTREVDLLLGGGTPADSGGLGVRQSRRIAQLKIREAEDRLKQEQIELEAFKNKKKNKKKSKYVEEEDVSDDEKKTKRIKFRFDPKKAWMSSSGEEEEPEEEVEPEEEEEEEPDDRALKSDHEFSPESDVEDADYQPVRRARTAHARKETPGKYDGVNCQKCEASDRPEWILLCDQCDMGCHTDCLKPPLHIVPEGEWFCPPCSLQKLVKQLQTTLRQYDRCEKQRENEQLRKKRLAFVGISLDNVLPQAVKKPKQAEDDRGEPSGSESGSSRASGTSEDEDGPVYQLRERRTKTSNYRFNEYDDLIRSAIRDEMCEDGGASVPEVTTPVDDGAKGDKSVVIEENKSGDQSAEASDVGGEEEEPNYSGETEDDVDELPTVVPRKRQLNKKKKKKLTSLEFSSDDEGDSNSDSDFKGSSLDEDEEDPDEDMSDDSEIRGRRRGRSDVATRRSTRARQRKMDRDFIDDDTSDNESASSIERAMATSESSDSDRSWGRKRKAKAAKRRAPSPPRKKKKKTVNKKKKKRSRNDSEDDSELEIKTKKKSKVKYGLDEDIDSKLTNRRTRGKQINYVQTMEDDTDSEKERLKRRRRQGRIGRFASEESDEDFKEDKEDSDDEDEESASPDASDDADDVPVKKKPKVEKVVPPPKKTKKIVKKKKEEEESSEDEEEEEEEEEKETKTPVKTKEKTKEVVAEPVVVPPVKKKGCKVKITPTRAEIAEKAAAAKAKKDGPEPPRTVPPRPPMPARPSFTPPHVRPAGPFPPTMGQPMPVPQMPTPLGHPMAANIPPQPMVPPHAMPANMPQMGPNMPPMAPNMPQMAPNIPPIVVNMPPQPMASIIPTQPMAPNMAPGMPSNMPQMAPNIPPMAPNIPPQPMAPNMPPQPMAPNMPPQPMAPNMPNMFPTRPVGPFQGFPSQLSPANISPEVKQRRKPGPKPGSKNKKKGEASEEGKGPGRTREDVTIATVQAPTQFPATSTCDEGSVITRMLNSSQVPPNLDASTGGTAPHYLPPRPLNPSPSGGTATLTPTPLYHPPRPLNPSPSGGTATLTPAPLYHPPRPLDPSPSGGGVFPPAPHPSYHSFPPQQQFPAAFPGGNFPPAVVQPKQFDDEEASEFGGLASYFASQAEEEMDS